MAALGVARTYCVCVVYILYYTGCVHTVLYCCNTNFIIYKSNGLVVIISMF